MVHHIPSFIPAQKSLSDHTIVEEDMKSKLRGVNYKVDAPRLFHFRLRNHCLGNPPGTIPQPPKRAGPAAR
jgi:hypothetical protein